MYTVIGRNLQTHTYKLEDDKGDTKTVHRNLLLDISFLPVMVNGEGLCDLGSENLDSLEEEDKGDRTSEWVMSVPESGRIE